MIENQESSRVDLKSLLIDQSKIVFPKPGSAVSEVAHMSPGMKANAFFFSHKRWAEKYYNCENHPGLLSARWKRATGGWHDKVVVDMGCGPGNLARLSLGQPKILVGVDISHGALERASNHGYQTLYADVHNTPLKDGIADLVTANALLHHVDDVEKVLAECARLVKPGGMLITDEDPILSKTTLSGVSSLITKIHSRIPISRVKNHPTTRWKYTSRSERINRLKTEIHFKHPGDGIDLSVFDRVLTPLGFIVKTYPHAHVAGDEIFYDEKGRRSALERLAHLAAGLDPDASDLQLSVMCIATKAT
jgi:ubiquinone/menaquinone biosynthesis C-methylase UbiE